MTLDLIEQMTALRGQVRAMESEWDAIRVQIQKGWQRVEKANERSERRKTMEGGGNSLPDSGDDHLLAEPLRTTVTVPLHGFNEKLRQMKEG